MKLLRAATALLLLAARAIDPGLIEKSGRPGDAGQFRTPSLRNVGVTAPWWYDGSEQTLEGAISRHQEFVPAEEVPALMPFLGALTDPHFITDPGLSRPDAACGKQL